MTRRTLKTLLNPFLYPSKRGTELLHADNCPPILTDLLTRQDLILAEQCRDRPRTSVTARAHAHTGDEKSWVCGKLTEGSEQVWEKLEVSTLELALGGKVQRTKYKEKVISRFNSGKEFSHLTIREFQLGVYRIYQNESVYQSPALRTS